MVQRQRTGEPRSCGHHLAFGKGIHFCVGAPLAKLEGRIAFEQLLRRLPGLRLRTDEAPVFRPYFMLRGFEHLPIAWDVQDT
ncbi:cytochrome P450 [Archangium violaceum]|uniref:cytochrome P450 n=1 Tax=Archangium violaceum TaxID=83451 RepID=UPI0013636A1A|nr:cytochrome P450 [Archangium violaceum]